MAKRAFILFCVVCVLSVFFLVNKDTTISGEKISQWKGAVAEAFKKAEKSILSIVDPDPDDSIIKPDEDINKCACGGTGYIVHADGHKTECPYHFKAPEVDTHACECDTRRTYCNCVKAYGECGCRPQKEGGILDFIFGR
tara:strand:+ start:6859 stop:7278 length:420 start_codon:yes stop_codon:yes gene_type:complete